LRAVDLRGTELHDCAHAHAGRADKHADNEPAADGPDSDERGASEPLNDDRANSPELWFVPDEFPGIRLRCGGYQSGADDNADDVEPTNAGTGLR
jgi:hypothetical protein